MKKALVTGASGTIGAAICQRLAEAGCHILVHANTRVETAAAIADGIQSGGGSAEPVAFDVTQPHRITSILHETVEPEQPIQIVVNNAGIHHDAPMAGMTLEAWSEVIGVSVNGFFNVTRPLLMPMIRTRWGRIVNISSVAGVMGNPGQVNYAAAKSALHGATKSLAQELASRGITVNCVAPGIIEGDMSSEAFGSDRIRSLVPMKRAGTPQEVAALVAFLCTDDASYISGQIIGINGAMA